MWLEEENEIRGGVVLLLLSYNTVDTKTKICTSSIIVYYSIHYYRELHSQLGIALDTGFAGPRGRDKHLPHARHSYAFPCIDRTHEPPWRVREVSDRPS